MVRLPGNAFVVVSLLLVTAVGGWLFSHYRDAYRVTVQPPNESWLREPPWDLAEQYGELAPYLQESLFFVTSEAGVLSLRLTYGPFTSTERASLESGFEAGVGTLAGASLRRCGTARVGADSWSCFAWRQSVDGLETEHRAYLSGRGVSVIVVVFSAVEGRFAIFGSPERWLRESVEWDGPSLLYAYF